MAAYAIKDPFVAAAFSLQRLLCPAACLDGAMVADEAVLLTGQIFSLIRSELVQGFLLLWADGCLHDEGKASLLIADPMYLVFLGQ